MIARVQAAIDDVRAWALAQFGWTWLELDIGVQDEGVRLSGSVVALRLVDRIVAACPGIPIDRSGVHVLRTGVFRAVGEHALVRRPERDSALATELDAGVVELLATHDGASLVRASDGTVGWLHAPLGEVASRPVFAVPTSLDEAAITGAFAAWIDVPYRLGGTRRAGIDCSGLVQRLLGGAGLRMPRHSTDQLAISLRPQPGPSPQIGSVIAVWSDDEAPCHVGLVVGVDTIVHASRSRARVVVEDCASFLGRAQKVAHVGVDALLRLQADAQHEFDLLVALR
jgi:hypothetical protein